MSEIQEKYEVLPATERAAMLSTEDSIFFNVAKFEQAQRIAQNVRIFNDGARAFQGESWKLYDRIELCGQDWSGPFYGAPNHVYCPWSAWG